MANKVVLILVDGMKADCVLSCENEFAKKCVKNHSAILNAQTVMPSVTLPCHMSLFLSVPPVRHGILSNTYVPMVRPVKSLFDCLANHDKTSAMFYNWDELRDLARPGKIVHSLFTEVDLEGKTDDVLTEAAIDCISQKEPDFVFLYLGCTDHVGHQSGWESAEYLSAVDHAFKCIEKLYNNIPDNYSVMITADHGGHLRGHGSDCPEDMTIPIIMISEHFSINDSSDCTPNIVDIAPTIADIIGIPPDKDWEGRSLI